jgi:hypothetical protein
MKIKIIIPTVGDGGNTSTSSFLLRISNNQKKLYKQLFTGTVDRKATEIKRLSIEPIPSKLYGSDRVIIRTAKNMNHRGEHIINCDRIRMNQVKEGIDPILETVSKKIQNNLFPTKDYDKDKVDFMNSITFKYFDGNVRIIYGRTNKRYYINTLPRNKADIVKAISKVILRASLSRSSVQLREYLRKVTTFPHNVLYALENRTPYHFLDEFRKTDVVINTKLISDKECVLEISDSTWGVISTKELSTFIDYYKFGKKRSKKWNIGVTNEFLWTELMGSPPTRTELEKMKQWLLQHRTSDIIEDRATKLLFDIAAETPQLDFVQFKNPKNKALFVHGKYSDWVITYTGDGMKRGNQDVNTHQVVGFSQEKGNWHGMKLSGSICIDNVSKGASIGDQLTARALALINEDIAAHHLYTIKPLITEDLRNGVKVMPRLDRSKLNAWSQRKCDEYLHKKKENK